MIRKVMILLVLFACAIFCLSAQELAPTTAGSDWTLQTTLAWAPLLDGLFDGPILVQLAELRVGVALNIIDGLPLYAGLEGHYANSAWLGEPLAICKIGAGLTCGLWLPLSTAFALGCELATGAESIIYPALDSFGFWGRVQIQAAVRLNPNVSLGLNAGLWFWTNRLSFDSAMYGTSIGASIAYQF
ncbi:MAG: hypothetical protein A2087_02250 [Spirochaetes bacterium GWD1_61_31]|nr:MAG: hypothetical protein A2Y37_00670 [Spirochaetes bacterium GWB1_60_80]OHD29472.1 MAG: hypothetical protein A2004_03715 [Spirochaetes bacterium GWC1_61_12]OHD43992.1 MAG: hypothetical protein A2087_02250 [Spirochaetes bacterium GWD1_61_31]OHD46196.1 MAG: hypothetical protein A2Y35_00855 [Spirochaetes bacterium GWE1_60_18]OHD60734.1 MAG: hypothetical protein A2Y32_07660 [Spirochaetes bacterium GWF1_60_12]HAP43874.1 hypothetical protein [Spirochaetaceae bacterium]